MRRIDVAISSDGETPPLSMREVVRKSGIEIQVRYLRLVALRRVLREDTLVESLMEEKAAHEGSWWSVSPKRLSAVTCVG